MSETSRAYNVVLIPSQDLSSKAIDFSKKLDIGNNYYVLQDALFYPHVSVFMFQLKSNHLDGVSGAINSIAQSFASFNLKAIAYGQAKGFFDIEYERTQDVGRLQSMIVDALNPLRDGMREKDIERMKLAEGLKLSNFTKYGWDSIGELYRPHLSITRFKDEQPLSTVDFPNPMTYSGTFNAIGLYEMGENGTCTKLVTQFPLLA